MVKTVLGESAAPPHIHGPAQAAQRQDHSELRGDPQLEMNDSGYEGNPGSCCAWTEPLLTKKREQLKTPGMFSEEEAAMGITRNLEHFTKEPPFQ